MPALFPQWSNTAARLVLGGLVLTAIGLPGALVVWMRTPYVTGEGYEVVQPVEFDHRHHVADDGLDCRYCHTTVERSPFASVPPTATCMNCHNQVWNDSPLLEPVRRSAFSGEPIQWRRVHDLPDFVYFDHSIHVSKGVGCVTCHGRVDEMPYIRQVQPLTMAWCLACHRDPAPNLRPRDQITSMTWQPAGDREALAAELAEEYGVRKLTNCTACHR
jgi:hypothetical protein